MVAKTDLTVLITGESGTGKELVARAVHDLSRRSGNAFVAVNCPTLPENILESELFGYKKGAFTHATQNKIGLFQEAHNGSIFLDEIGDITPAIQTKLLRVLQEKEIKPLGDTKSITVDVRIIASTNQNLAQKIKIDEFREDVYYRLNVLPIKLPALREHPEDIPLIAGHLLEKHCILLDKPSKKISSELMDIFLRKTWPGNVREMENRIRRSVIMCEGKRVRLADLGLDRSFARYASMTLREAREAVERDLVEMALTRHDDNMSRVAEDLGISRPTLYELIEKLGIERS
jgi:transcriptional regulator with PAS, ATPase and Fis domain